jgi:hypothetical protein
MTIRRSIRANPRHTYKISRDAAGQRGARSPAASRLTRLVVEALLVVFLLLRVRVI